MAKTWLITGSSRGFGWELARAVLEDGDNVVATARRPEQLDDLVRQYGERVRTCALDVTDAQAAKFAVEGFSEVLHNEVKPLGIKVTIIEPSAFRTDWATRTMPVSADYERSVGAMIRSRSATDGRQPGDPARAAELIIGIARLDEPPLRLLLGAAALESAEKASRARGAEAEEWAAVGRSAE